MNIKAKLALGLCAALLAGSAQASLIVRSINLAMVESDFNPRQELRGNMPDERAFFRSLLREFLPAYNNPDTLICEKSLDVFVGISSSETCNGPRRNVGSLFAITGSATGPTELQLGLDWGRGGFSLLALAGFGPQIERYNTDIWWRRDWEHRDVLNFFIPQTDNLLLVGLGFEGCCDGDNSARWRSLGSGLIGLRTLNEEPPGEWQTLAVNDVPEPGVLPLLGLGLMGLVYARRQSAGCPCRI